MKGWKNLIYGIVLSISVTTHAMTREQEQQFLYYYYDAIQLFQQGDYATSFQEFLFLEQLHPLDPGVNLYLGIFYDGYHHSDEALSHFQTAYEQYPQEYWLQYVVALFRKGDNTSKKQAIAVLEQVSLRDKDNVDVWENLRQAYSATGQYSAAIHAQDEIDRIEGYSGLSAMNRYRIHVLQQDLKQAIADINRYLQDDPNDLQFLIFRAELYEATHQKKEMLIQAYEQVLRQDPHNVVILNNYAYLLATHHGDLSLAEMMSQAAVKYEPTNATYLDTYAWILYMRGNQALAELYIRRAIECSGEEVNKEILQHQKTILRHPK